MRVKSRWSPSSREDCRLRIIEGAKAIDDILSELKIVFYEYNRSIKDTGYYLKPVHKVYKTYGGIRRVYEYYGRYWWKLRKKNGKLRYVYVGSRKPRAVKLKPPDNPLQGLSLIREGSDVIVKCEDFRIFSHVFKGYKVISES